MVTMGFLKSSSFHPTALKFDRAHVIFTELFGSPSERRGSPVIL